MIIIKKDDVCKKIKNYLEHRIDHKELVSWAEDVMQEGTLDENDIDVLRRVVSLIGVSDVKAFGLAWEDCENILKQLGYSVKLEIVSDLICA